MCSVSFWFLGPTLRTHRGCTLAFCLQVGGPHVRTQNALYSLPNFQYRSRIDSAKPIIDSIPHKYPHLNRPTLILIHLWFQREFNIWKNEKYIKIHKDIIFCWSFEFLKCFDTQLDSLGIAGLPLIAHLTKPRQLWDLDGRCIHTMGGAKDSTENEHQVTGRH
jgi:hypothetical protein